MLSWLSPIVTPTKQISAELVTIWLVLGSEHLACKLFMGKELELGVLLSMVVEHKIPRHQPQASVPGTRFRYPKHSANFQEESPASKEKNPASLEETPASLEAISGS